MDCGAEREEAEEAEEAATETDKLSGENPKSFHIKLRVGLTVFTPSDSV